MNIISEIKKVIEVNQMGHLPLLYRVLLAKQIKDKETLFKIHFECAKKVYPIWEEEYPDIDILYKMLFKINDYLYQNKGTKEELIQIADKHKNYIEGINSDAGAVGQATLNLCYSIGMDTIFNENYNATDDDNNLEYEDRCPDYYASLAYSGGNPFLFNGDIEKRREFWNWYISIVEMLIVNSKNPILPLEEKKIVLIEPESFKRTQTYKDEKNEALIQKVIYMTIDFLKENKILYETFRLNSNCIIFTNTSSLYFTRNNKEEELILSPLDWFGFSPAKVLYELKSNMYKQNPQEGAWLNCRLDVDNKNNYKLYLNYDYKDLLFDSNINEATLVNEFEHFPRSKEYTSDWWQKILGRKVKYLK